MQITAQDVLLIIDVQNDFCSEGALAVERGEEVVPVINSLISQFNHVILSQDWHPQGHSSFASSHAGLKPFTTIQMSYGQQVLWPDHCVQGTIGAEFRTGLDVVSTELILRKGFRREIDSYSAFLENDHRTSTGLAGYLRERQIERVFCVGLALDYCVRYSAIDAVAHGFSSFVIEEACRAIGPLDSTFREFHERGVQRISSLAAFI